MCEDDQGLVSELGGPWQSLTPVSPVLGHASMDKNLPREISSGNIYISTVFIITHTQDIRVHVCLNNFYHPTAGILYNSKKVWWKTQRIIIIIIFISMIKHLTHDTACYRSPKLQFNNNKGYAYRHNASKCRSTMLFTLKKHSLLNYEILHYNLNKKLIISTLRKFFVFKKYKNKLTTTSIFFNHSCLLKSLMFLFLTLKSSHILEEKQVSTQMRIFILYI